MTRRQRPVDVVVDCMPQYDTGAGIGPKNLDVLELRGCITANELTTHGRKVIANRRRSGRKRLSA